MDPLRRAVGEILKARPELVECGGEKVSFTTGKFELGHSYRIDPEVWSKYLIDLFCCIFVVDAADAENLDKCRRTLHKGRAAGRAGRGGRRGRSGRGGRWGGEERGVDAVAVEELQGEGRGASACAKSLAYLSAAIVRLLGTPRPSGRGGGAGRGGAGRPAHRRSLPALRRRRGRAPPPP
eukprot:tig00000133_g7693.t1